jgi:hypothetical protein
MPDGVPQQRVHRHAFYEAVLNEAVLNAAWTASRLTIGGMSFLFGAFAFAYCYPQSADPGAAGSPVPVGRVRFRQRLRRLLSGGIGGLAVGHDLARDTLHEGAFDPGDLVRGAAAYLK